ncbi:putative serine/threonine-protein kinase [Nymphaea thermarum]|nr:putative serine/threonine-protein kinase [Nymphaea thermarum]
MQRAQNIACAPPTCDGISINYPFSLSSQSGSGCGYPGLNLLCLDNNRTLLLQTPTLNFTVSGIDYSARTIDVAIDPRYMEGPGNCQYPRKNMTLQDIKGTANPLPFIFANGATTQVTFFYNCTTPPSSGSGGYGGDAYDFTGKVVPSCSAAALRSYAFFGADSPGTVAMSCQSSVTFPVSASSIANNLMSALSDGFSMNWTVDATNRCYGCSQSGGRCGSDSTGNFICFCQADSQPDTCNHSGRKNTGIIAGVTTASGILIIVMFLTFFWFRYYRAKKRSSSTIYTKSTTSSMTSSQFDLDSRSFQQRYGGNVTIFTYKELQEATNDFSSSKELGDGGFGTVYLGKLHDGRKVAVKRLYENNYRRVAQFMNEIAILSNINHPKLVRLYGCTSRHSRELLLVYEYINNGTVSDHIRASHAGKRHLKWKVRLTIAIETAEALAYLHQLDPPIIHRDVKTNNILLDSKFHVKVADFGLSRLFPADVTHVSTAPQGTPGYVDPDYHKCYQLTDKSDVYSFGVVLAELISSLPAVDIRRHRHEINLANLAVNKIHNHELHEFVDSSIGFETDEWVNRTVKAVAELAFRCLAAEKEVRPNMDEVAESFKRIQAGEHCPEKRTFTEIKSDTGPLPKPNGSLSPNSVTDKWESHYTAPNNTPNTSTG